MSVSSVMYLVFKVQRSWAVNPRNFWLNLDLWVGTRFQLFSSPTGIGYPAASVYVCNWLKVTITYNHTVQLDNFYLVVILRKVRNS